MKNSAAETVADLNNVKLLRQRITQLENTLDESRTNANVVSSRKLSGELQLLLICRRLFDVLYETFPGSFHSSRVLSL